MRTPSEIKRIRAAEARMFDVSHYYLKTALSAATALRTGSEAYLNHKNTRAYLEMVRENSLNAYRKARKQRA